MYISVGRKRKPDATHGHLGKLIDQYGSKENKKVYNLIREDQSIIKKKEYKKLRLPKEFKKFDEVSVTFFQRKKSNELLEQKKHKFTNYTKV